MIRKISMTALAAGLLCTAAAEAQTSPQAPSAVQAAVAACLSVIEDGSQPAPAFSGAGLAPSPVHTGLKGAFFASVDDSRWFSRRLEPGMIQVGVSASARSCAVFLLDAVGQPANQRVAGRFAGWERQELPSGTVAYSRATKDGDTLVVSIHTGPATVKPGQLGSMVKVYLRR